MPNVQQYLKTFFFFSWDAVGIADAVIEHFNAFSRLCYIWLKHVTLHTSQIWRPVRHQIKTRIAQAMDAAYIFSGFYMHITILLIKFYFGHFKHSWLTLWQVTHSEDATHDDELNNAENFIYK